MGVKGLWQLLEPVGRPVTLESLEGKVLSVDASILLNQAVKGMRDKSGNPFPNAHLVVLFNRLCKLLFYRIKPIFVFDGGVPILKKKTLAARRERKFKARHGSNKAAEMLVKSYLKGKALETVTGKKSGSVIRNKSPKDPDIFELPPISKIQDTIEECSSESDDDDTNVLQQLYSQSNIEKKFQDPSLINVESDDFRSLPEEIQHELIKKKMEDRKWSTIESLPQDAFCFSDYQLQSVLHRGKLHQRLDELRKQMNNRNNGEVSGLSSKDAIGAESSVQSQRIVSEDSAHYVLIKTSKNNSNENKEFPKVDPSSEGGFFRDDPDVQPQQPKPTSLPRVRSFELDDVTCENSSDSDLDLSLLDVPEVVYDWETSQKKNEKGSLTVEVVREKDVRRGDAEGEQEDMNQYENIDCLGKNNEGTIQVQGNNFNRKSEENLDLVKGEKKDLVDLNEQNKTEVEETLNDLNLNEGGTEDSEAINAENDFNEQSKTEVKERSNDLILNEGETEDSEAINAEIDKRRSQIEMLLKTRERASLSSHGEVMEKTSDEYSANQNLEEDDNATVDKDYGRLVLQAGDDLNEFRLHVESSNEEDEDIISPREQLLTSDGNDMEDVETVQDKQRDQEISVVREGLEKDNPEITDQEEKLKVIIIDDQDNKANKNDKEGEDMEVEEEADLSSDETTEPEKETSIVPSEFTGTSKEDLEVMQVHLEMEQRSLQTEQARQERMAASISNEMVTESQELLRLFGVPYITSPMEAEAQCAFLDFTQQTSGTITDDSDVFLFGGRRVYKHIFNQNKHAELYTIDAISGHLALDRSKMIKLAFITGSDYTEGIQGLGVVGAMEVLQEFNNDGFEALQKFRKWHEETKKNKNSLQETKVKQKLRSLSLPAGFPSQEVFESYINPVIDESRETFEWGKPDLHALRLFAREKLGWSVVKTDDVLLPVLKQLNKQESQMRIDSFLQIKFQETRKKSSKRVRRVINRFNNPLSSSGSSSSENEDKNKKLNSTSDRKTSDSQSNSGKGKGKGSGCRKKMTGLRVARGRGSSRGRRIPSTLQTEEDKANGSDGRSLNDRSVTSNDRDESVAILRENDITTEDGRGSTLGNRKRTEKGRKVEKTNVGGKKAGNLNIELFDIQQQDEGYVMNKNNYYPKETNDIHDERTLKPQGDRNAEKMKGSNSLSNIENNLKVRRNLKTQGDRSNSISNVENSDVAVVDFMQKNNANNKKYKIPKKKFSTSIDESGSSGIGNLNDDSSTSSDTDSEEDRRIHSLSENIRRNKHGGRGLGRKRTRGRGRGGINKRSKIKM